MARKRATQNLEDALRKAVHSLPVVGRIFNETVEDHTRRQRQLEFELGQHRNALVIGLRAIGDTIRGLHGMIEELEGARETIRRLVQEAPGEELREQALKTS